MASAAFLKLLCVGLMGMLVLSPHAEAQVSCGTVTGKLGPCIPYVTGRGPLSPGCCSGVKDLNYLASNPANRRSICFCLKSLLGSYRSYLGKAQGLPGACGVTPVYSISPSVNCATLT